MCPETNAEMYTKLCIGAYNTRIQVVYGSDKNQQNNTVKTRNCFKRSLKEHREDADFISGSS